MFSSHFGRKVVALVAASLFLSLFLEIQTTALGGGKDNDKKDVKKKDAKKNAKKDESVKHLMKQLLARFDAWDTNNDQVLDKFELAKAFRGGNAKPFDAAPPVKEPTKDKPKEKSKEPTKTPEQSLKASLEEKGKVRTISLALVSLPRGGMAVNLMAAELLSHTLPVKALPPPKETPKKPQESPPQQPKLSPAVMQLGDFQFLALLNKNRDNRITRQEFDAWAKGYAKLLDRHDELEKEVKEAKSHVSQAKTPQARAKAEKELAFHLKEIQQVTVQLNAIPPAIHKALKAAK